MLKELPKKKKIMSPLGHSRLGKIDSRLVRESVIKIRAANCGAFVHDENGTVRNCAFRSFPVGVVGSAKFPPSVFFFSFQFCRRNERDKQKRCDEVGRLDISPAGRTA